MTVILRDGDTRNIEGEVGLSLMEIARDAGIDEIQALCGGCCSCATCHIYVDDAMLGDLPEMASDEDELLSSSDHRRANSRLACQIAFSKPLQDLRFEIAPED